MRRGWISTSMSGYRISNSRSTASAATGHPEDGRAHLQEGAPSSLGQDRARHGSIGELDRQPGLTQERPARLGELDARPPIAGEEPGVEGTLQLPDLLGETRLSDVEPFGRFPEVELLGDRDEVPELAKLDVCHRSLPTPVTDIPHHGFGEGIVN